MAGENTPGAAPNLGRLGRFELLSPVLGGGGVERFIARREGTEELCILRRLPKAREKDGVALAQLLEAARVGSLLAHPNIVRTLEAGIESGVFCIVTELVQGASLREVQLQLRERAFPAPVAVSIAAAILGALDHAHTRAGEDGVALGLAHGALSPHVVRLGLRGEVKVGDFAAGVPPHDPEGGVEALAYLAPEDAPLPGMGHASADLYAAAVMLFEMLAGQDLIARTGSAADVLAAVASVAPPPLHSRAPGVPPELSEVVARALARDPSARFPSAASFGAALVRAMPSVSADGARPGAFLGEVMAERARSGAPRVETSRAFSDPARAALPTALVPRRPASRPAAVEPPQEITQLGAVVLEMPGEAVPVGKTSIDWLIRRHRRSYSLVVLLLGVAIGLLLALVFGMHREQPAPVLAPAAAAVERLPATPRASSVAGTDPERSASDEASRPMPQAREIHEAREAREARDGREPREAREAHETSETGEVHQAREVRQAREVHQTREVHEARSDARSDRGHPRPQGVDLASVDRDPPGSAVGTHGSLPVESAPELRSLRGALAHLRQAPARDHRAFLQLRDQIERSSADLSGGDRARVESRLNAAELTYDLDVLESAIQELERARAAEGGAR